VTARGEDTVRWLVHAYLAEAGGLRIAALATGALHRRDLGQSTLHAGPQVVQLIVVAASQHVSGARTRAIE